MPIVAIGAAIGSLALGGASAIGAVVAGTATLATTLTAVATVGSVLGAVGAVTHDKTLSTVGLVMGGVGGVGALAANAGLFGASATTQSLFGGASSAASDIGTVTSTPINAAFDPALDAISSTPMNAAFAADPAMKGIQDIVGSLAGNGPVVSTTPMNSAFLSPNGAVNAAAPLPDPMAAVKTATTTPNPVSNLTGSTEDRFLPQADQSGATSSLTANAPDIATGLTPQQNGMINPGLGETKVGVDGTTYKFNGTTWQPQYGLFEGLMKSQMGQYSLIQTAGSFAGGLLESLTDNLKPAQVEALSAQAAANRAAATLAERQNANMSANIPVARRVQPAAVTGMINAPANSNGVTGQVAI